jgi:hypothetical protein
MWSSCLVDYFERRNSVIFPCKTQLAAIIVSCFDALQVSRMFGVSVQRVEGKENGPDA